MPAFCARQPWSGNKAQRNPLEGAGGAWLAQNRGRWEMGRVRGARGVLHRAKAEGAASVHTPLPLPAARQLWLSLPSAKCSPQADPLLVVSSVSPHRTPLVWGKSHPARAETLPPVTEAEIQPEAGAALGRAGRKGRRHLAAACGSQEGPDLA